MTKTLRPFWCYYGGKWRSAPRYPQPKHNTIIEPFAGAAGYALRYHERKVILVEKDERLVALWHYLIRATASDFLTMPDVPDDGTVDDISACAEAKTLIGFWLNKGAAAPCKRPSAWMRSRIRPASYWGPEIRTLLAAQAGKIGHWRVIHGDYSIAPDHKATWFIDPPYVGAGKLYRHSSKDIDYRALAEWCLSRQGQTLVCENSGATWLPFADFISAKSTPGSRGKGRSAEALWVNESALTCSRCGVEVHRSWDHLDVTEYGERWTCTATSVPSPTLTQGVAP
jgi:hypothetical protein